MTTISARDVRHEPTRPVSANEQALTREVLDATGGLAVPELLVHRLGTLIDAVDLVFLDVVVNTHDAEHHHGTDIEAVAVTKELVVHLHAHVSGSAETHRHVSSEVDIRTTSRIDRLVIDDQDAAVDPAHPGLRPRLRSVRIVFADDHSLSVPLSERGRDRISETMHAFLPLQRPT